MDSPAPSRRALSPALTPVPSSVSNILQSSSKSPTQAVDATHPLASSSQLPPTSSSPALSLLSSHSSLSMQPSASHASSSSTDSLSPDTSPLTPPEDPYSDPHCHIDLSYYDSPPSPPSTIEDQLYDAYALDNIHLAKILLLKLKGIEVTDDNDPRIAQVKDEDFDETFMPYGPIQLDEETEKLYRESLRQEREFKRRKAREDRLRACEKIWEHWGNRLREQKARAARKKEEDARERRRLDIEAREKRQRSKDIDLTDSRPSSSSFIPYSYTTTPGTIRPPKPSSPTYLYPRAVLSYGSLPGASNSPPSTPPALAAHQQYQQQYHQRRSATPPPTFQYSVMSCSRSPPLSSSPSRLSPPNQKKSPLSSPHRALLELSSQAVPFAAVVKSMYGPLFPVSEDDDASAICGKADKRRSDQQVQLLEDLLVRGSFGEQTHTQPTVSAPSASRSVSTLSVLSALSPTALDSSSSGSSATITTRKSTIFSSWMSPFGRGRDATSSRRSVSTIVTSPTSVSLLDPKSVASSSSPVVPLVASSSPSASSSSPWSSRARARASSPSTSPSSSRFRRRIIRVSRSAKVQVANGEDPLKPLTPLVPFSSNPTPTRTPPSRRHRLIHTLSSHITHYVSSSSSKPSTAAEVGLVKRMGRSMSMFMDSYVKATMFTAGDDLYSYPSSRSVYSSFDSSRETVGRVRASIKVPGNRGRRSTDGYRVSVEDVVVFVSPPPLHAISALPTPSSVRYAPPPSPPTSTSSLPSSSFEPELNKPHDLDDYIVSHPRTRTHPLIQLLPVCLSTSSTCPSKPLVFPAPVLPPRSPFRPDYPPAYVMARFRPVSNPLMLRLRAVMNVCEALGVGVGCESVARVREEFLQKQRLMQMQQQRELERQMMSESGGDDVDTRRGRERERGRGAQRQYAYQELFYHQALVKKQEVVVQHEHVQRETREKVLGVAYEGIGRSSLGWEVRVR